MNIKIKTNQIEIEIDDNPLLNSDGIMGREVPALPVCVESAVTQAIRLHNEAGENKSTVLKD